MAIYDCFQYFNEDHMVDIRLNILNDHVDYFVISESTKTHQGKNKKINFNSNNFPKFKKKIKFVVADYNEEINFTNDEGKKAILNSKSKFLSLMLIFGQLNLLKIIMRKFNIQNQEIEKVEDLYFN